VLRVADHFERTDTGRQRKANEDAYFARSPLFAVADGMGGAQAGEVASHLAVEVLEQGLPDGPGSMEERLAERVREANARINELSRSDDQRAGMGTTLTAAYVGEDEVAVAHVGDSRLYRLRDGHFERLTDDHSLVEELVRQGRLTPKEADEHPQRSIITRALGPEEGVEPDSRTWPAREGDVYLLCSDGLTSMVPEERVGEVVRTAADLPAAGRGLIDEANRAGGRDNITVILFRLEAVEPAHAAAAAAPTEQATAVGEAAPRAEDVRGALATERAADTTLEQTVAPRRPRPAREPVGRAGRHPDVPPPAAKAKRKRRRRIPGAAVAGIVILLFVGLGFWFASQAVYFVGTSPDGFVSVYRGLPYDLPLGLDLYTENYESGVPVSDLAAPQRRVVAEHKLRSLDDANDLVSQIETGTLGA
jgi:serine/threonine protein phosphatase PrpC